MNVPPEAPAAPTADSRPSTPARRSASDPVLALADQAWVSGTRFVTTVAVGRVAGPGELGVYALAMAALILAGCAQESLVTKPYTILRDGRPGRERVYAGSVLAHFGAGVGGVAAAFLFAAGVAAAAWGDRPAVVLAVLAGVAPLSLLWEFARRMSFAHLRLGVALAVDAGLGTLQLGGLAALAAAGRLTAVTALLVVGASSAVVGLTWLALNRRRFRVRASAVGADWRRNWRFGRWICAAQVCGSANGSLPHWVLAAVAGVAATGRFAAAQNVVLLCNPLILAVANLLVPRTAEARRTGGPAAVRRLVLRAAAVLVASAASFWAVLLVAAGPLLGLLYGGEFADAVPAILVLGVAPVAWSLSTAFEAGLSAVDRPDLGFRAMLFGLVATAATAAALAGPFGPAGAAAAVTLGSGVSAASLAVSFLRLTGGAGVR